MVRVGAVRAYMRSRGIEQGQIMSDVEMAQWIADNIDGLCALRYECDIENEFDKILQVAIIGAVKKAKGK